jgi:hypothetical protein
MDPNNNNGITYQTDEKHLTNSTEYFVGAIKLAWYRLNTCFLLHVIYQ